MASLELRTFLYDDATKAETRGPDGKLEGLPHVESVTPADQGRRQEGIRPVTSASRTPTPWKQRRWQEPAAGQLRDQSPMTLPTGRDPQRDPAGRRQGDP